MGRKGCSRGGSGGMVSQVRCAHRNRTQWVARAVLGAVLGGWYRKFAALTATKKWGAGATLLSAMGRKGCAMGYARGMVSQVRCAHRYEEMGCRGHASERNGSQGLFWGNRIASSLRSPQRRNGVQGPRL